MKMKLYLMKKLHKIYSLIYLIYLLKPDRIFEGLLLTCCHFFIQKYAIQSFNAIKAIKELKENFENPN